MRFIPLDDLSQSPVAKGRIKIIATKNWSKGKSSFESELRTNFAKLEKCYSIYSENLDDFEKYVFLPFFLIFIFYG